MTQMTADLTPSMEPHTGMSADIRCATAIIGGVSPIMSALANLLNTIADDMDEAPAYERKAFPGTAAEHLQVWDNDGVRIDWTEALKLARTILVAQPRGGNWPSPSLVDDERARRIVTAGIEATR